MRHAIESFTFDFLDDIAPGLSSATLKPDDIPPLTADSLGPLLEWEQILPRLGAAAENSSWLSTVDFAELRKQLASMNVWFNASETQALVPVAKLLRDSTAWVDLAIRAKRAATRVGLSSDHAGKLVAAIGEIYGNIIDHSDSIESGYVAYAAKGSHFEFIVADRGVGVFRSLRSNPDYSDLPDPGSALELALSEGVSRYSEPGRGLGFRPLFVGLANVSRSVRFRSGDSGRIVNRFQDGSIQATTTQLADIEGLFCSVLCEAD
jgi:anti-sigma regulatory factor (Ser/Thr protein kinase)